MTINQYFFDLFKKYKLKFYMNNTPTKYDYSYQAISYGFFLFTEQLEQKGFSTQLIQQYGDYFSVNEFHQIVRGIEIQSQKLNYYCFASVNRNGYVRELALQQLIKNITRRSLPFILVRLTDHVEKIRKLAKQSLFDVLREEHRSDLFYYLKHLIHLKNQKYIESQQSYAQIIDFLFLNENGFKDIQFSNDLQRYLIANILEERNYDRKKLADWFIKDRFFLIRKKVFQYADVLPRATILELLNDYSAVVRKHALYWLADHGNKIEKNKYYCEKLMDR